MRRGTTNAFSRCFTSLALIKNYGINLDRLLTSYLDFLEEKPGSQKYLLLRLGFIADLVLAFLKFKIAPRGLLLNAYRDILKLYLSVIVSSKKKSVKEVRRPVVKKSTEPKGIEKEILDFVKSKDKIRNLELFSNFNQLHKRTIKRHISRLINKGAIKRAAKGKAVFYSYSKP